MDHGQFSQFQNPYIGVSIETRSGSGYGDRDRNPQWSSEETREFLVIRAELDPTFMETKRNRFLWELVSARMTEIGYNRTPVQCKCKWKNLVTRYKGCETMEQLEMRQSTFPFYNEMQIIFDARMQRMLWQEVEGGGGGGTVTSSPAALQIPSNSNDDDDNNREKKKKKKKRKEKAAANSGGETSSGNSSVVHGFKEIMEEFMSQQMEMEMQWIKSYEEREDRRIEMEGVWRQRMEAMESERLMMLRWWREREEERKMREEARAERRDALVTALLNKLRNEGM